MSNRKRPFRFAAALVAAAVLLAPATASAQRGETGLVAFYAFDGDVTDAGANNYDGRTVGSPSYVRGVRGSAISFDGVDDVVRLGAIPSATYDSGWSATWFMRIDDLQRYSLLSRADACTGGHAIDARVATRPTALVEFGLSTPLTQSVASAGLRAGAWVHVALVRDGASARVYVDGVPGADAAAVTPDLTRTLSALAFGDSPCIGVDGTRRFRGQLDELRIYSRALAADEVEELAAVPAVTLSPSSVSQGGSVSFAATDLVAGRTYRLRTTARDATRTLATFTAAGSTHRGRFVVPDLAAGSYPVALQYDFFLRTVTHASSQMVVVPSLSVAVSTSSPQAGKSMAVNVGNLVPGSVRLRYAGRVVAGPVAVDGATASLRFTVPTDIPASLPATVTLVAELLSGRSVARTGSTTVPVAAPFTGRFATPTGLTSSATQPRPEQRVRLSGQLNLADGTTSRDVDVTAWWVGADGSVTPLPTTALAVNTDGSFNLDLVPPSLAGMTATVPRGAGRLRVVTRRTNAYGRPEVSIQEGPSLTTVLDTDPQTDITLRIRAVGANNVPTPIEGAYVVVDPAAPLQGFEVPPAPPSNGPSTYQSPGLGATQVYAPPAIDFGLASQPAVSQVSGTLGGIQRPPPPCGTSLFRRYSDAEGRASFNVQAEQDGAPSGYFGLATLGWQATDCSGLLGCGGAQVSPVNTFDITVYTLHKGAGFRDDNGFEVPTRLRVVYYRATRLFRITNLRTGAVTEQVNSANVAIDVPLRAVGPVVTIQPPIMFRPPPAGGVITRTETGPLGTTVRFSGWPNFSTGYHSRVGVNEIASPVYTFRNVAPRNYIAFRHRADAGGPLVSARLVVDAPPPGSAPRVLGQFAPAGNPPACTIQDDGSSSGVVLWQLELDGSLWRQPQSLTIIPYVDKPLVVRGRIEFTNQQGASGSFPVEFEWVPLRDFICRLDESTTPPTIIRPCDPVTVDDTIADNVLAFAETIHSNQAEQQNFPTRLGDNQLRGDPQKRNNARVVEKRSGSTGGGDSSALDGLVDRQLNKDGNDRSGIANKDGANLVEFGSPEPQTVLDKEIPLLQVTFGIPGIAGADAYASLRLLADYLYYGRAGVIPGRGPYMQLSTEAAFSIFINAGVDLDVLFGLLFDAGFGLSGIARSSMQTLVETGRATQAGTCLKFILEFFAYFDPCPICPTPAIEERYPIFSEDLSSGCPNLVAGSNRAAEFSEAVKQLAYAAARQRSLRRHPALSFDDAGNGSLAALDDTRRLMVRALDDGVPGAATMLSDAPAIRNAQVAHYAPNRAIAVWVESALSAPQITALNPTGFSSTAFRDTVRQQRIMWSRYNGASWSEKQALTSGAAGEGFLSLSACPAGALSCPVNGEVFLAFQRNTSGDHRSPTYRVYSARWRPIGGWTAPEAVATGSGIQDITPTAGYIGATPLVAWIRLLGTDPVTAPRRLASRVVGVGAVQVADVLPPGANAPTLATRSGIGAVGSRNAFLALMAPEATTGPVGIGQALYLASSACDTGAGTCNWLVRKARVKDQPGTAVYGDRPTLLRTSGGTAAAMRVFGFKPKEPDTVDTPGADATRGTGIGPIGQLPQIGYSGVDLMTPTVGLLNGAGDQYRLALDFLTGDVVPTALTSDGLGYYGLAAAWDFANDRIMTVGAPNPDALPPAGMVKLMKAAGARVQPASGKAIAMVDGVELRAGDDVPDLAVISIAASATTTQPGAAMTATVTIANAGTRYDPAVDGTARLMLFWNAPRGRGSALATVDIAALDPGASRSIAVPFTQPAEALPDEPHTLHVVVVPDAAMNEIAGDNNEGRFGFAGLPVPTGLEFTAPAGASLVQLAWTPVDDPRVAGYRVYRREADGDWVPLGASATAGFLDLSAQFGVPRLYAVTSYSARGVESERSAPLSAAPRPLELAPAPGDTLFGDGFEAAGAGSR